MLIFQTPAWWQSPVTWILGALGAIALAAGIIRVWYRGIPQQTISSLNEATDAGAKVQTAQERRIAQLEREKAELEKERDGYKADVAKLLREGCVRLDIEAADKKTIDELQDKLAEKTREEINVRLELANVLRQLNEKERDAHDKH